MGKTEAAQKRQLLEEYPERAGAKGTAPPVPWLCLLSPCVALGKLQGTSGPPTPKWATQAPDDSCVEMGSSWVDVLYVCVCICACVYACVCVCLSVYVCLYTYACKGIQDVCE